MSNSITNIIPNLRKHFTEDNTPEGNLDGRKVVLGSIAAIGVIVVIAAIIGLAAGIPLLGIGLVVGGAAIALSLRKLHVINTSSQAPLQEDSDHSILPQDSSTQNQRSIAREQRQQTLQEIGEKYGIKPKNNNQQKPLSQKTEDLQSNATNFADAAERLKKKFANKPWYEFWT